MTCAHATVSCVYFDPERPTTSGYQRCNVCREVVPWPEPAADTLAARLELVAAYRAAEGVGRMRCGFDPSRHASAAWLEVACPSCSFVYGFTEDAGRHPEPLDLDAYAAGALARAIVDHEREQEGT